VFFAKLEQLYGIACRLYFVVCKKTKYKRPIMGHCKYGYEMQPSEVKPDLNNARYNIGYKSTVF